MSIKYTCEISSMSEFPAWSGGKQNLEKVIEKGQIDELDSLVEELYYDNTPTEGELNDLLWFGLDEIDEFKHLWDTESWVLQSEEDGEVVYFVSADEMPTEDANKAAHFDSEEAADEARINIADVKWPNGSWEVVSTFDLDESVKEDASDLYSYKDSLKKDYLAGKITASEVAEELHNAGYINFIPDDAKALTMIGISEDAPAQGSTEDEIKQWRIPNPLGIDTIFVGTKKAAEEYGKKYGFTPEEVQ